ncbi:MAG: hypothetical protein HKO62_06480 [Gammaproteobacteria bacterium]|nr:hypothetical protein [Gammaproteobacteria bacterium]
MTHVIDIAATQADYDPAVYAALAPLIDDPALTSASYAGRADERILALLFDRRQRETEAGRDFRVAGMDTANRWGLETAFWLEEGDPVPEVLAPAWMREWRISVEGVPTADLFIVDIPGLTPVYFADRGLPIRFAMVNVDPELLAQDIVALSRYDWRQSGGTTIGALRANPIQDPPAAEFPE